jgi:molybdenum cofactor cytidylyltransferase
VGKVAGLLLAAGASSRMGRPKQLMPVSGSGLLDIVLGEALRSDLDLVNLVLGHQADEIKKALRTDLRHPKLKITFNNQYRDGISTSIRSGLSEVDVAYDHVMIILADMPRLTSKLINLLLHRYFESSFSLGALQTSTKRSHPVIIGRQFYPALRQLRGDVGARDLFLAYPGHVLLVETGTDYDDRDIDTMDDYLDLSKETAKKSDDER